jgi:hypothetical protein
MSEAIFSCLSIKQALLQARVLEEEILDLLMTYSSLFSGLAP